MHAFPDLPSYLFVRQPPLATSHGSTLVGILVSPFPGLPVWPLVNDEAQDSFQIHNW
jgi:hypothetical protein